MRNDSSTDSFVDNIFSTFDRAINEDVAADNKLRELVHFYAKRENEPSVQEMELYVTDLQNAVKEATDSALKSEAKMVIQQYKDRIVMAKNLALKESVEESNPVLSSEIPYSEVVVDQRLVESGMLYQDTADFVNTGDKAYSIKAINESGMIYDLLFKQPEILADFYEKNKDKVLREAKAEDTEDKKEKKEKIDKFAVTEELVDALIAEMKIDAEKFDKAQIVKGLKDEQEHLASLEALKNGDEDIKHTLVNIVLDHLKEVPDWYTRETKMKAKAEKDLAKEAKVEPTEPATEKKEPKGVKEPKEDKTEKVEESFDAGAYEVKINKPQVNEEKDPASENQKKTAIDTVKNPAKALLGGPSEKEAIEILKTKFGYTDDQIKKLQECSEGDNSSEKGSDDQEADVAFWVKMFTPRTRQWQKETLASLKKGENRLDTPIARERKIEALKSLLENYNETTDSSTATIIARSISDQNAANQLASDKKGRAVPDKDDPKKWMVEVDEAVADEVKVSEETLAKIKAARSAEIAYADNSAKKDYLMRLVLTGNVVKVSVEIDGVAGVDVIETLSDATVDSLIQELYAKVEYLESLGFEVTKIGV